MSIVDCPGATQEGVLMGQAAISGSFLPFEPLVESIIHPLEHVARVPGKIGKLAPLGEIAILPLDLLDELLYEHPLLRVLCPEVFLALVRRLFLPVFGAESHSVPMVSCSYRRVQNTGDAELQPRWLPPSAGPRATKSRRAKFGLNEQGMTTARPRGPMFPSDYWNS